MSEKLPSGRAILLEEWLRARNDAILLLALSGGSYVRERERVIASRERM